MCQARHGREDWSVISITQFSVMTLFLVVEATNNNRRLPPRRDQADAGRPICRSDRKGPSMSRLNETITTGPNVLVE